MILFGGLFSVVLICIDVFIIKVIEVFEKQLALKNKNSKPKRKEALALHSRNLVTPLA